MKILLITIVLIVSSASHGYVCENDASYDIDARSDMIDDVVDVWNMKYADDGVLSDNRQDSFMEYAGYVVDSVLWYQCNSANIGGNIPIGVNAHIMVATIITFESAARSKAIGNRNEIGLMQIMPMSPAMAGYDANYVANRPGLNVRLGVRWLAYSIYRCGGNIKDPNDWIGPLSFYSLSRMVNGKCMKLKMAKRRLKMYLEYIGRIDRE
jgi:hypothetical protein